MRADYRNLLTQAYDIDKPEPPPGELAYYREFVDAAGGPVLEAMCGSGRFLIPFLEAGVDIDGVDSSEDMLAACERRCAERSITATLIRQDVQRLSLPRRYSLIFCGGGSFGLIADVDEATEAIRRLHAHLVPGGVLLLEVETPKGTGRGGVWGGRFWRRPDGGIIALRGILRAPADDLEEGLGIYELFVDGQLVETELNEWTRRFWTAAGIAGALEDAGFVDIRVTAAYSTTESPADGATQLSVAARRVAG